uniref:Uncharacterized protein n=1 Tax=Siphoviridae sp. ctUWs1 TaxID=2826352 RepID=A0A8S5QUN0_9CAUD|nr:MAG TPA: hypothetical protein [Siphoviridae sp. ctUWs1]
MAPVPNHREPSQGDHSAIHPQHPAHGGERETACAARCPETRACYTTHHQWRRGVTGTP